MKQPPFQKIIKKLKTHYGTPAPPATSDAFEMILWENVVYLVDDTRRQKSFDDLRTRVGLKPIDIFKATMRQLDRVTGLDQRSARLKESALIALNEFGGDLNLSLQLPTAKAMRVLKQFPGIGEPGAEKILLFTKTLPVLALDSNGLRVMLRLGFGEEKKAYKASYKLVRDAVSDQCGNDCEYLIEAHQLLRQHGKTICKTSKPQCDICPVRSLCVYYATHSIR
jgi:endonuclease-3